MNFAHHHALLPLVSERTQWLQVRLHQERLWQTWGIAPGTAQGFFPTETAFSERLIPLLASLGIQWTFVSNEHLSRACPDFPVILGSGGVMCDPPNRADQVNPPGAPYWRKFIDRGCSPANAYPFAYTPHRAQYVDPATGAVSSLIVVPTAQAISWDDGYGQIGANALDGIAGGNDPARPMLVVLAHDGDNAWGGGYSYYMEAVQNFCADASAQGYVPTTVEEYLAEHPVPAGDVVHVEDGGWVNADSDFGSPVFTNWLFPLLAADGGIDVLGGWHDKAREYAIYTAAENRIRTAEDLAGGPGTTRIDHVLDPSATTTPVERAWSYYLASMDSGHVYFGNALDAEVKGTVGCNEAAQHVDPILAGMAPGQDQTEPTVFVPQRHPYNPGSVSFGAQYGYQSFVNDGSFDVWTFAYDVSGLQSATLRYRVDADGQNPLATTDNETYAGGPGVGAWQAIPMDVRAFPAGNVYGWGGLEAYAFEQPLHVAQHLSATVPALNEQLLDYYVEVLDTRGNLARTAIQHVWIGDGQGATGGAGAVAVAPDPPVQGAPATITYDAAGRSLEGAPAVYVHLGYDGWAPGTVQHLPMSAAGSDLWSFALTVPPGVGQLDCAFNDDPEGDGGTWDNNGGADWHFATAVPVLPVADFLGAPLAGTAPLQVSFTQLAAGDPTGFAWDFDGDGQTDSTEPDPSHVFGAGLHTVSLTVSNAQGADTETKVGYVSVAAPPAGPTLVLDASTVAAAAEVGQDAPSAMLGLANAGSRSVSYRLVPVFPGGAPPATRGRVLGAPGGAGAPAFGVGLGTGPAESGWLLPVPAQGLLGPGATVAVELGFASALLPGGTHGATLLVLSDSPDSPQTVAVALTLSPPPPAQTGVVPDPPEAGSPARIWYHAAGTPLAGVGAVLAHWGLDGWEPATVLDEPMTAAGPELWYLDVDLPAGATELDFVFTDGQGLWDNNGGQDWVFPVVPPSGGGPGPPVLAVNPILLSTTAAQGTSPAPSTFSVANGGGGVLNYALSVVDTGDGTGWLAVAPAAGSSAGEADAIAVSYQAAGLAAGSYQARIDVAGHGLGAAENVFVVLNVQAAPPAATTVVPDPPVAGAPARIWYASAGGPLAGAGSVLCHWGLDGWDPDTIVDQLMTPAGGGSWYLDVNLPPGTAELDFVFTDGQGNWDNNGGQDWIFPVVQ